MFEKNINNIMDQLIHDIREKYVDILHIPVNSCKKRLIYLGLIDLLKVKDYSFVEEDFPIACTSGCLNMAQYVLEKIQYKIQYNIQNKKWNIMDFFRSNPKENVIDFKSAFLASCYGKNLDLVRWILELIKDVDKFVLDIQKSKFAFFGAFSESNLEIAQFIFELIKPIDIEDLFLRTCKCGNLKLIKFLWSTGLYTSTKKAFRYACFGGNLEMVTYLWELSLLENNETIDIHADDDVIFKIACYSNNLEVVKYIWEISLHDINFYINGSYFFYHEEYYNDETQYDFLRKIELDLNIGRSIGNISNDIRHWIIRLN